MKPEIIEYKDHPKGSTFSMHYHIKKEETWYVVKGNLELSYYDLTNATRITQTIKAGTVVDIKPNIPHKLIALEDSEIIEVSTQHFEYDSYRVEPGDSQK